MKLAHELLPGEVHRVALGSSMAFVPVSPAFEWHSFHLPLGCDALIAEGYARLLAEAFDGLCFSVLSFGLDAWRTPEELATWGFSSDQRIYGMNFPALPVRCEYAEEPEMDKAVRNRLAAIRDTGFRHAFIVNQHGGRGQDALLRRIAGEETRDGLRVTLLRPRPSSGILEGDFRVGGHAGLCETTWLMSVRPDLVDLTHLPKGALRVSETGILHGQPEIEERYSPHRALLSLANALRASVVETLSAAVREATA